MPPKAKALSRRAKPANYKQQTLLSHFSSSPPPPTSSNRKSQRIGKTKPKRVQESESDVELVESPVLKPDRRERRAVPNSEGESDSSDVGKIKFERYSSTDQGSGGTSGQASLEDEPLSPSRPAKRQRLLNSDSDENDVAGKRQGKLASRRLVKRDQQEESGSQSESDVPQKRRSRLVKGKRPASAEEGDDLMDGIDELSECLIFTKFLLSANLFRNRRKPPPRPSVTKK